MSLSSCMRSLTRSLQKVRAQSSSFSHVSLREYQHDKDNDTKPNTSGLLFRLADVFTRTWNLGFTAFGGPPVHFGILHRRFVETQGGKTKWFDEQTVSLTQIYTFNDYS